MFTITLNDERVYQALMRKAAEHGGSVDAVLQEVLDFDENIEIENANVTDQETPAQRLLRLIDEAADELVFLTELDARDADEVLRRETGMIAWRNATGDNGTD